MSEQHTERLEILDLMRLVAALSVVVYHFTSQPLYLGPAEADRFTLLQQFTKFGFLGVELFFLISGFVIFWSASGRTLAAYAASRLSRLLPTLWAAVLLTSLLLVLTGQSAGIVEPKVLAANLALVAGPLNLPYVDGVYWTLQYEVKFYALAWLVIWASRRVRLENLLALWLLGLASVYAAFAPKGVASLTLFPYGSYFVGGSLFFVIWREGMSRLRLVLLTGSLILSLLCLRSETAHFTAGDVSTPTLLIAATIVIAQYLFFGAVALRMFKLPASEWWIGLGSLTYPLYLIHNVIRRTLTVYCVPLLGDVMAVVFGIAVSLALAAILARTTETQGCRWLRRLLLNVFNSLKTERLPQPEPSPQTPP